VVNYLPVGSTLATEFYANAAIEAGCGFVNCIPVFIASNDAWAQKFADAGLPVVGDDIKAQVGATILHRTLTNLFLDRGMRIEHTYQLNTGGNTDFLNMLERERLVDKKTSKTEAVTSMIEARGQSIAPGDIHVGPSDYVAWQKDNKICFLRIESKHFGDVPMNLEVRLSVEDSPNSAGVAIDSIRCCKLALDAGLSGAIIEPAARTSASIRRSRSRTARPVSSSRPTSPGTATRTDRGDRADSPAARECRPPARSTRRSA
jgi:myo-inositol-1-phosphate synthase